MECASKKKRWILIFGPVFWALLILFLCLVPSGDLPNPGWKIPHVDKWVHFGLFLGLAFFLYAGWMALGKAARRKVWAPVLLLSFLYGALIEWLQANFFSRSGDLWDLAADVAGAVAGCLLYLAWYKSRKWFLSRPQL